MYVATCMYVYLCLYVCMYVRMCVCGIILYLYVSMCPYVAIMYVYNKWVTKIHNNYANNVLCILLHYAAICTFKAKTSWLTING